MSKEIVNDLVFLFGLENPNQLAREIDVPRGNLNSLMTGTAGKGVTVAYSLLVSVCKELPRWKLEEVLEKWKKERKIK